MIRITLNLGRRPPENLRRVRLVWGGALAVLAALLLTLATVALVGWLGTRHIQAQTAALRAAMTPLQAEQERAQAPLRDSQTQAVIARAAFFNQLIDRKSVSWTRLFERLEQIVPPGVELVSLRPLARDGAQAVDVRFASETLPPAIAFVQALENSGDFAAARVERESEAAPQALGTAAGPNTPPRFQLEVTALYRPQNAAATPPGGQP